MATRTLNVSSQVIQQPVQAPAEGSTSAREDSQQEQNEEDIQLAREYISRVSAVSRFRATTESWTEARTGESEDGQPGSQVPGSNSTEWLRENEPIDVVVHDLYARRAQSLGSIRALRQHLRERERANFTRYVYLVSDESPCEELVGLLGSALDITPEFWAGHQDETGQQSAQMRPTLVARRRSTRLTFVTTGQSDIRHGGLRRTISMGFSAQSHNYPSGTLTHAVSLLCEEKRQVSD